MPATGRLIVASPSLDDPNFERSVVLLLDHDEDGSLGVIVNRTSAVAVSDTLEGWVDLVVDPRVVFGGGPVEPTALVAIGESREAPDGWIPIVDGVRLVSLDAEPGQLAVDVSRMRIFAGYAGWGPGQLEAEISAGAWFVVDAEPGDVFHPDPDQLWRHVLRRQPGRLRMLATYPDDPSTN